MRSEEYVYEYFSEVFDQLFTNLVLKNTYISLDTKKLLEILATPIYNKSKKEKEIIYKKIMNM